MPRKRAPGRPATMVPLTIHLTTTQRKKLVRLSTASGRSMTSELRLLIENAKVGGL